MGDLNQERGGILGLIDRIRSGAGLADDPAGVSPEVQAQQAQQTPVNPNSAAPGTNYPAGKDAYGVSDEAKAAYGSNLDQVKPPAASAQVPDAKTSPLQEWPDEKETDVATGMTTVPTPQTLTPEAVAAAGTEPHNRPMAQSSHVRGGSPGQQPGGPAAEGDISSAPTKIDDDVHQALVSQGVDPRVAAMLADAQKRQSQLQEGLDKSKSERFFANEHFAMQSGFGIRGAKETLDSNLAGVDQRYKGIQDQQKAGDEALTHAESLRGFNRALDADNPDSDISKEVAKITGKRAPASLYPQLKDYAENELKKKDERGRTERNAATIQGEGERNTATNKKDIDVALIRASVDRHNNKPDPHATQTQQTQLADIRAARKMLLDLDKHQTEGDVNGPLSAVSALLGRVGIDTDAAKVDAEGRIAGRVTGRGIEGGKFSDQDAVFYDRYGVGQAGDPVDLQRAKNRAALKRLDEKEKELLTSMSEAGVNTSGMTARSSAGRPVVGPKGEKGTLAAGHPLPSGWSYR